MFDPEEPIIPDRLGAFSEPAPIRVWVADDAIVMWMRSVFKTFGDLSKSVNRRLRMNTIRMPNKTIVLTSAQP
jgi:hypothetical protein